MDFRFLQGLIQPVSVVGKRFKKRPAIIIRHHDMTLKGKSMMSKPAPAHRAGFTGSTWFQLFFGPIHKRQPRTFAKNGAQGFFENVPVEKGRLSGKTVAGVNGTIRQEGYELGEATVVGAAIERHAAINDPLEDAMGRVDGNRPHYGHPEPVGPAFFHVDLNQ
jgi:hypothetical protein